ncbi:MAG: Kynurenine formamidase [Myxococcota bacterium]|nr:Kynurenine formamidase [Myxococcota bacterium]
MSERRIHDISPPITPRIGVWPGDTPFSRQVLCDMKAGANLTLSSLTSTVHLGAHADAPNHYGRDAGGAGERPLAPYLGPCQVMRVAAARNQRIGTRQLTGPITAPRVLFHTGTFPDPDRFTTDFAAFEPELLEYLHGQGVVLAGIDTPSVDLFDSKDLPAHQVLLRHDMAVLEGLVLDRVPPGNYELIALPLRLMGFDASPVRAILREW